jgi:peptide/nickel transport system permease protein
MTSATTTPAKPTQPDYSAPPATQPPLRRNFLRQTLYDTFNQFGARIGSVWIVLLILAGIGAPFIASTHPILMKADHAWSSPMWTFLTPVDLVLTALGLTTIALLLTRKLGFGQSLLVLVATIAVVSPAAFLFKSSPDTVNYQRYRDLEREGRVQFILRTVIPFSASDRMRDIPAARLSPPSWYPPVKNALHRVAPGTFDPPDPILVARAAALPSWSVLGTETNGADLFSRMIHASRIALSIGFISTSIAVTIGVLIGGLMGYYVGKVDLFGMRLIEIFEAIPTLIILITVMAAYGRNLYLMMVVIGLLGWTGTARFIRAEFLRLRQQDFVQAAVALGLPEPLVIYRHILPNGVTPILVTASFGIASAILTEATLSFLGLGLIDEPSWGQMLNQARSGGQGFVWWMALFPGMAIFLTVYSYSLIGDAMRDALDPKLRKRD